MRTDIGFLVACTSVFWVLLEGVAAYFARTLTPSQMAKKYPEHPKTLAFICHGGMWGDLFIISTIVGVTVAMYGGQWTLIQMLVMFGLGSLLSIAMHCIYILTPFPDSLAWKKGISVAGYMHILYMGIAFAIIGLLYFYTANVSMPLLVITGVLLTTHVVIGNHVVLGLLNETHHWSWCPDFIHKPDPWITITGACAILVAMTVWRVDMVAGISVLMMCMFIAMMVYMYVSKTLSNGTRAKM